MSEKSFVIRPSTELINANRVILFLFTLWQSSILLSMALISMRGNDHAALNNIGALFFITLISLFVIHAVDRVQGRDDEAITMESGRVFQRNQLWIRRKIFWCTALPLMIINPWLGLGIALLAYRTYDIYHDITPVAFLGPRKFDLKKIDGTSASINNGTLAVTPANPKFMRSMFK